ncbi:MAG TPA: RNA polymerase subunit sigma-70 [Trebonia sp.]|nr:RNA polymerase subunit sigma-70 [Trebonia sp.]
MSTTQTGDAMVPAGLLAAARAGDGEAFRVLVSPHRPALHLHAYRMLGSLDEADDAVQEALLRAWRALDTYRDQAPLRHWLYRITTTSSLKIIHARARRPVAAGEIGHLQPYPDRLLDQLTDAGADPAAIAEQRESVALAFIAALQRLPARQRAVLILRDVLAWNAAEVAALLDCSVASVTSALQRARVTLTAVGPAGSGTVHASLGERERQLLDRFVDAWQRCDVDALAALLRQDVILSMPPELTTITGRAEVARFFATVPAGGRLDTIRLVRTRANGHPALAAYLPDHSARCQGYGIMVFTTTGDSIATITGFPSPDLFGRFGLPAAYG